MSVFEKHSGRAGALNNDSPLKTGVLYGLKNAEAPQSSLNLLSWTLLKKLKRLFRFRPPHSPKHAVENLG